jgi:hypothetical protein
MPHHLVVARCCLRAHFKKHLHNVNCFGPCLAGLSGPGSATCCSRSQVGGRTLGARDDEVAWRAPFGTRPGFGDEVLGVDGGLDVDLVRQALSLESSKPHVWALHDDAVMRMSSNSEFAPGIVSRGRPVFRGVPWIGAGEEFVRHATVSRA